MLKKLIVLAILAVSAAVLNSPAQVMPPKCTPGAPNCVAVNR